MNEKVEMFRDSGEPGGRDLFACSVAEWTLFQELARDFGWVPRGTTYTAPSDSKVAAPAFHGYTAGSTADPKIVERTDALNWARALEDRKRSLESAPSQQGADSEPTGLIDEFIEYAYGGAFTFVLAAADAHPVE